MGGLDPPWQGLCCPVRVTRGPWQAGVCGRHSGCPGLEKQPLVGSEGFLVHSLTSTQGCVPRSHGVLLHFLIDGPGMSFMWNILQPPWEIKGEPPSGGVGCLPPPLPDLHNALLPGLASRPHSRAGDLLLAPSSRDALFPPCPALAWECTSDPQVLPSERDLLLGLWFWPHITGS